jgi:hypothetical protein
MGIQKIHRTDTRGKAKGKRQKAKVTDQTRFHFCLLLFASCLLPCGAAARLCGEIPDYTARM